MSTDGQRTKQRRNISIAWVERTNATDRRQTDDRLTGDDIYQMLYLAYTISNGFMCFILTVKQSAALVAYALRATTKKVNFLKGKVHLAWGFSDLEMTWLPWSPGAATMTLTAKAFVGLSCCKTVRLLADKHFFLGGFGMLGFYSNLRIGLMLSS